MTEGGSAAAIALGSFVAALLLLAWLRVLFTGPIPGWVPVYNVHLNLRWGKPDRKILKKLKAKARGDVLKTLGGCADDLVIELNEKLEIIEEKAARVVPPASTAWLGVLVVFEALQFIAIPFASGVSWNRDSKLGILAKVGACLACSNASGIGHYAFINYLISKHTFGNVAWEGALIIAMLLLYVLVAMAVHCGQDLSPAAMRLQNGAVFLSRSILWLLVVLKELVLEFGSLYIVTGVLTIMSCSMHDANFTDTRCWQVASHSALIPIAIAHIVLYFSFLFWNDLPLHTAPSFLQEMLKKMGVTVGGIWQKDDYMLLNAELSSSDIQLDTLTTTGGVQVFDFDRPMFSSWSSGVYGSVKLVLGFVYVFAGDRAEWQWTVLGICALCYFVLILYNIQMLPCSFHWVNVSRTMGLLAGFGAVGCGLLAAGLGSTSDVPLITLVVIVISMLLVSPFVLYWVHDSLDTEMEIGRLMNMDILQNYERLVILCQINQLVREGILQVREKEMPRTNVKCAMFSKSRDLMIRNTSTRLMLWLGEWSMWSRTQHDKDLMSKIKVNKKVEQWMATASFIIDPSEDVELGLNMPLDKYFSLVDGAPRYTADEDPIHTRGPPPELLDCDANSPAAAHSMSCITDELSDGPYGRLNIQDGHFTSLARLNTRFQ